MLVRCDPENPILEGFYMRLAIHQGWTSLDQILASSDDDTVKHDWKQVLAYSETNNPYISVCAGYVPFISALNPLYVFKGSTAGWVLQDEYSV